MTETTFDRDGNPTDETLATLRSGDFASPTDALDFLRAAWNVQYGSVTETLTDAERSVLHSGWGDRYLRLTTGGWSANESLIGAYQRTFGWAVTWQLSARGGLHMFKYPPRTIPHSTGNPPYGLYPWGCR